MYARAGQPDIHTVSSEGEKWTRSNEQYTNLEMIPESDNPLVFIFSFCRSNAPRLLWIL